MTERPKTLGALLLRQGVLTETQLQQALSRQRATGKVLGAILVEDGVLTPQALLAVLSEQSGIPHRALRVAEMDWSVADTMPSAALSSDQWFPICSDESSLTIAISDPLDAWSLSDAQCHAKFLAIRPVLVLDQELKAVCQAYRQRRLQRLQERLTRDANNDHH